MATRITTKLFIDRASIIHNNKYDYSLTNYISAKTKIKIICSDHGIFEQTPSDHLNGTGCPYCANKYQTTEKFSTKANIVHNNKYDYSIVEYVNSISKIKIICPEHGVFEQTPNNHLRGRKCPICSHVNASKAKRLHLQEFIDRSVTVHNNKYDYSLVEYINTETKVQIICPKHGIFEQSPGHHLCGSGCRKCTASVNSKKLALTTQEFIKKSIDVHGDTYRYSNVDYTNTYINVNIECKIHGTFQQMPTHHLRGSGCPICHNSISSYETEIVTFLSENNISYIQSNRTIIKPYELDIYLPDYNIAIEFNGLYQHSEQILKLSNKNNKGHHIKKYDLCKEQNIQLLTILESEWLTKKDIIKSIILAKCNIHNRRLHSNDYIVKNITNNDAIHFLNTNHYQGFSGGIHIGLWYNNEIVSLMTFRKQAGNIYKMYRFANINNSLVYNSFSKLVTFFITNYNPTKIIAVSDNRYFTGGIYIDNGFVVTHNIGPTYYYFKGKYDVLNKSSFMKHKLKDKLDTYDPKLTEYQNMLNNGYDRIWDCGKINFEMNINR